MNVQLANVNPNKTPFPLFHHSIYSVTRQAPYSALAWTGSYVGLSGRPPHPLLDLAFQLVLLRLWRT
jgi:hypothetical protein